MTSDIERIQILHLGKDDVLDIEERAGKADVQREEEAVAAGAYGEPVTFCLALLTAAALKAYVAHLKYKEAVLPDAKLTQSVVVTRVDGTTEEHTLTLEAREGEQFSDAVARELSTVPGLDAVLQGGGL